MRVAIVGAGISGLQQGRALQKRGIDFHIYGSDAGVGGVWRVTTHLQGAQGKPTSLSIPWMGAFCGNINHLGKLHGTVDIVTRSKSCLPCACAVPYPYYEFPEFPWPEALRQKYKDAMTPPAQAVQQYIQVMFDGTALLC